jgi:hypothetical protein
MDKCWLQHQIYKFIVRSDTGNGGKDPPTVEITHGKNNINKIRYP